MSSRNPSGPLRHKRIEMKRPTTTGGKPIPVLIKAATTERPGNLDRASAIPSGIPSTSETNVEQPEICRDNQVTVQTSVSKLKTRSKALTMPCQKSATLNSEL